MKIAFDELINNGVTLCKQGFWDEGLFCLGQAAQSEDPFKYVPGLAYSYMGYGIALRENRIREGIALCQKAVQIGFYDGDNFLNLARTFLLQENRRDAAKAIIKGLAVEPHNKGLLSLQAQIGLRRPPVVPFLARGHRLNYWLGKVRHQLFGPLVDKTSSIKPVL